MDLIWTMVCVSRKWRLIDGCGTSISICHATQRQGKNFLIPQMVWSNLSMTPSTYGNIELQSPDETMAQTAARLRRGRLRWRILPGSIAWMAWILITSVKFWSNLCYTGGERTLILVNMWISCHMGQLRLSPLDEDWRDRCKNGRQRGSRHQSCEQQVFGETEGRSSVIYGGRRSKNHVRQ